MNTYYILLGSNQGNRLDFLHAAIKGIENMLGTLTASSSVYETEPWGMKEQGNFLNMALEVKSEKSPEEAFDVISGIESEIGTGKEVKWGPRNIDIDILYCNDFIINTEKLIIPHPRLYDRNFVLIPLIEIAGEVVDPVKKMTIDELYDICKDTGEVFLFEE